MAMGQLSESQRAEIQRQQRENDAYMQSLDSPNMGMRGRKMNPKHPFASGFMSGAMLSVSMHVQAKQKADVEQRKAAMPKLKDVSNDGPEYGG